MSRTSNLQVWSGELVQGGWRVPLGGAASMIALVLGSACSILTGPDDPVELRWADLGRECTPEAPALSLPDARRDSLPPPEDDLNGDWANLAARAPGGWGGYFIGTAGPTVYLVDPAQAETAIAFLRAEGLLIPADVNVMQGRWDFAQLYDWYRYLLPIVLSQGDMTYADINEATNRLEFGVVSELARGHLDSTVAGLGVPCFLVAIEVKARGRT